MGLGFATTVLCAAIAFVHMPVAAQVSFGNEGPIDVKAERATYKGALTVLTGNVRAKQKDATIFADRMDLYRAKTEIKKPENSEDPEDSEDKVENFVKLGNINRIVAVGHFKYVTPENRITGEKGVYERDKEIITVIGNAKFVQSNGNTVTGKRMIYDLTTNRAKIDGKCTGRDCKRNDRVEINIGGKK